jgi:HK97 gp10 family phage protein
VADRVEYHDGDANAFLLAQAAVLFETIAVAIEAGAKRRCPVDTGRLRSSITHEIGISGRSVEARVGTNVEYAAYVELGTRRTPSQPYLRPALLAVQGRTYR